MVSILAYQKHITREVTREINFPSDAEGRPLGVELANLGGVTYVSLPDGAKLPKEQPPEIAEGIRAVVMTPELRAALREASPCVRFINLRVQQMIAEHYSATDEIKLLRTAPSPEFEAYNEHVEACRAWGRKEKQALGL